MLPPRDQPRTAQLKPWVGSPQNFPWAVVKVCAPTEHQCQGANPVPTDYPTGCPHTGTAQGTCAECTEESYQLCEGRDGTLISPLHPLLTCSGPWHPEAPDLGREGASPWDRPAQPSPGSWAAWGRWILQRCPAPAYRRTESSRTTVEPVCVCARVRAHIHAQALVHTRMGAGGFPASRMAGLFSGDSQPYSGLCWPPIRGQALCQLQRSEAPCPGPVLLRLGL